MLYPPKLTVFISRL